jgi:hypothetical protein
MSKFKIIGIFLFIALIMLANSNIVIPSIAAGCNLTKVHISQQALHTETATVKITAVPSCWSGAVEVNQGNRDQHIITVQVSNGIGFGIIPRPEGTGSCSIWCYHPYALIPGLRGNNIFIAQG